jgi:hypothetical protein
MRERNTSTLAGSGKISLETGQAAHEIKLAILVGQAVSPAETSATGCGGLLPPLRSGQVLLDEIEDASVAMLRFDGIPSKFAGLA